MEKKISVVIPTYKRAELLKKCLLSLNAQTFKDSDYEVIVVSDGPDEETRQLISGFNSNITYLHLEQKKGPAAARNLGWLKASGLLVAFTDDDCLPASNWLELIWSRYQGEKEIVYSGKVIVPISKQPTDYELTTASLERADFITANCACTKEALIRVGGFDERFEQAWREDSDLHFKFLIHNIPLLKIEAEVVHPVRPATWGVSLREQKKGMYNALLYKKYPSLYQSKIASKAPWNYYAIILAFTGMLGGLLTGSMLLAKLCFWAWLFFVGMFTLKRLSATSRRFDHVTEMIVTSIFIPFLSVYWQFYGSLKYRVLFI